MYTNLELFQEVSGSWPAAKWLQLKWVHMRLRKISDLKPKGCEQRQITLDTLKLSIYRPIRCCHSRNPLRRHIKHQT